MTLHGLCANQLPSLEFRQNLFRRNIAEQTGLPFGSVLEGVLLSGNLHFLGQVSCPSNYVGYMTLFRILRSLRDNSNSLGCYGYRRIAVPFFGKAKCTLANASPLKSQFN